MRNLRHLLIVTLVAGSLYADRGAAALPAPAAGPTLAGRLMHRLTGGLRRTMPSVANCQAPRQAVFVSQEFRPARVTLRTAPAAILLDPFEFRLPPPTV